MSETTVTVKIEIPKDCRVKYEINKETGTIEVNRVLKVKYPFNYGFIPNTLWDDGDPLDVIVIGTFSLYPGVELEAKPIAIVKMTDNGESDYKVVCAINGEKFEDYKEIIDGFLKTYKTGVEIHGHEEKKEEIWNQIAKAANAYVDNP